MLLENLNPRRHLSAAIGWSVFIIIALAAPFCAWLVAKETEHYSRLASTQLLQQNATQIHREIATNLESRLSMLRLAAAQIDQTPHSSAELQRLLSAIQQQYPEFDWLGLADIHGDVIAGTSNVFVGRNFSYQQWYKNGIRTPYMGDIRYANALADMLPSGINRKAFRVIDVAAPVESLNGAVIGAYISWDWIQNLQALSLSRVDSKTPEIQLILVAEDNAVLSGPADLVGKPVPDRSELTENGKYLIGIQKTEDSNSATLDWTVIVRADISKAISAAGSTQLLVILTIIAAGSLAAFLIVFSVSKLTRNLRKLSVDAEKIAAGEIQEFKPVKGSDEVSRIGQVLATSMGNLQRQKQTLETLNSELDERVEERTRVINRLSGESREIALTQQRLRFARDMHDTLAHSMMAVLTQIRLIRKVRNRLTEEEIEEELGRAEDVALSGLTEARNAILQIRTNVIEDKSLSAGLNELVERYRDRSSINCSLHIDPKSIHQENNRAETVYRIVEEALRNIEKHASANNVAIRLNRLETADQDNNAMPEFELEINDDGIGFDTESVGAGHYGLIGLREQAELVDGTLIIDSAPGRGTNICLKYPAYSA